jgi:hypothetical protein
LFSPTLPPLDHDRMNSMEQTKSIMIRQLANAARAFQMQRISGRKVSEAAAQLDPRTGSVVQGFTTDTTVQVFQLDDGMPDDTFLHSDLETPA